LQTWRSLVNEHNMSDSVIIADNISKRYRLGLEEKGDKTLAGQFMNMVKAPFQNFKRLTSLSKFRADDDSVFWALKDINFELKKGEVLGIIGKNGAGKSTLLKILSRITDPTTGTVKIRGRVASLLEVGTGFHPELTGLENVYMNGTILGMRRKEIDKKFAEIVAFSGVEKFINTPVKFYSSGMKVRLGFAVAAHLDPEILIVDEVLSVGDAEFQKKAMGKMKEVTTGEGRTVLFVSHNMRAVKRLCKRGIVLSNGSVAFDGGIEEAVNFYLPGNDEGETLDTAVVEWDEETAPGQGEVRLIKAFISGNDALPRNTFSTSEAVNIQLFLKIGSTLRNLRVNLQLLDDEENIIFTTTSQNFVQGILVEGIHQAMVQIPPDLLNERNYNIRLSAGIQGVQNYILPFSLFSFKMSFADNASAPLHVSGKWPGVVAPVLEWRFTQVN